MLKTTFERYLLSQAWRGPVQQRPEWIRKPQRRRDTMLGNRKVSKSHTKIYNITNAWTSRSFFTQQQISDFDNARDSCLGAREDRTPNRPTQTAEGVWLGGTAFERNPEADQSAFRVFTLGASFERQTSKMAPAAPGKVHGGWSEVNQMRKDLLKVRLLPFCTISPQTKGAVVHDAGIIKYSKIIVHQRS